MGYIGHKVYFQTPDIHGFMAPSARELLKRVENALGTDRREVLESLRKNGNLLARIPEELRTDKEVVLTAVRQCGSAMEFALEPLRSDRELALEAVKQCGHALEVVEPLFQADKEIVLAAVSENGNAIQYADLSLRKDPVFLLHALGQGAAAASAVAFAEELLQDPAFLKEVVRRNPWTLGFLPEPSRRDPDIIREAVQRNGRRWNPLHPNCKSSGRSTWTRRSPDSAQPSRVRAVGPCPVGKGMTCFGRAVARDRDR